jgi:hypothetical protein
VGGGQLGRSSEMSFKDMQQPPGSHCPGAQTLSLPKEVKTPCAVEHRQPGRRLPGSGPGCMKKRCKTGDAMTWTKPAFEEIKMDAEAKSYSGEGDNFEE